MKHSFNCLLMLLSLASPSQADNIAFETSLGAEDGYMGKYYKKMRLQLSDHSNEWFKHIKPHNPNDVLYLLKSLYTDHLNRLPASPQEPRIPKIIHQIWIGPHPFPEKYKAWQKSWQNIPGWTYKLWTDDDVADLPMVNKDIYYKEKNYGARADILRIEILNQIGGLYVDTDFECIQPEVFDALNSSCDFYCGICPIDCEGLLLNNAIIASIPGHPILQAIIRNFKPLVKYLLDTNMWWGDIILEKGPGLLTKMFIEHANKGFHDVAFPPSFFYPLGVYQINNRKWVEAFSKRAFFKRVKDEVVKKESAAIHWWDGTWTLPTAHPQ